MVQQNKVEHKMQPFTYEKPEIDQVRGKSFAKGLPNTGVVAIMIQAVQLGGENNLHSHPGFDSVFFVLAGRARFYDDVETVACELGPHEGVLIRRGDPYWFESASAEELEIMHIKGFVPGAKDVRINYTPALPHQGDSQFGEGAINVWEQQEKPQS